MHVRMNAGARQHRNERRHCCCTSVPYGGSRPRSVRAVGRDRVAHHQAVQLELGRNPPDLGRVARERPAVAAGALDQHCRIFGVSGACRRSLQLNSN